MANETALLIHLEEYSKRFQRHLQTLQECHARLEIVWSRLHEIYEGEGAEMFAEVFEAASHRLREYAAEGAQISLLLERKIEELRVVNSPHPGL
jgi:hypothetical protein